MRDEDEKDRYIDELVEDVARRGADIATLQAGVRELIGVRDSLRERTYDLEAALRRVTGSREHYMGHMDEMPCDLCQLLAPVEETALD